MSQQKVWTKNDVQELLNNSKAAVAKAVLTLYARQTSEEQAVGATRVHNARGFNSRDAEFLSDIAVKLPRYSMNLTDRQLARVRPMMLKYWRQLLEEIEAKGGRVDYTAHNRKAAQSPIRESAHSTARPTAPQSAGSPPITMGMF